MSPLICAFLVPTSRSAVIAVSWGSTAAPPSRWDKELTDKHHIGNV